MDDGLLDIVLNRLADKPLAEATVGLLLAALDSDESLPTQDGRPGRITARTRSAVASGRARRCLPGQCPNCQDSSVLSVLITAEGIIDGNLSANRSHETALQCSDPPVGDRVMLS
jgi:hypothetical protein